MNSEGDSDLNSLRQREERRVESEREKQTTAPPLLTFDLQSVFVKVCTDRVCGTDSRLR